MAAGGSDQKTDLDPDFKQVLDTTWKHRAAHRLPYRRRNDDQTKALTERRLCGWGGGHTVKTQRPPLLLPYLLLNRIWTHSLSVLMSSVSRMKESHFSARKQAPLVCDGTAADLDLIFSIYSISTWQMSTSFL